MDFNQELDATGLNCPLPILRAKKTIALMNTGEVLKVLSTDPGSVKDFEAFCNQTGHTLEKSGQMNGKFEFYIKRG
jgi:tRNA 2-thiouridine synthesizing protein A